MAPILGIFASKYTPLGDFESIATVSLSSNNASISFSSIPSTYKHLQIRGIARGTNASNEVGVYLRINSDSGSNYAYHYLAGDGASASAGASTPETRFLLGQISAASSSSNIFGAFVLDILDYANTNKYKTGRSLTGTDRNGGGAMVLYSSLWMSTSAITGVVLSCTNAEFLSGSTVALYGIKG